MLGDVIEKEGTCTKEINNPSIAEGRSCCVHGEENKAWILGNVNDYFE